MIDMNKEYVTKGDGLPVRIYCTDAGGVFPVHGAVMTGGAWIMCEWDDVGQLRHPTGRPHQFDLIEKPQTVTRWVNVYEAGLAGGGMATRSQADDLSGSNRIGVLRIEITGDSFEVFKEDV